MKNIMEIKKNIRGIRAGNKYSGAENSEKNLKKILDIFFPNCLAEKTKITYEPEYGNRKVSYFEIDSLVNFKDKKLAFEYDGPPHFNNIFTIEKDLRKTKVLENLGFISKIIGPLSVNLNCTLILPIRFNSFATPTSNFSI